MATHPPHFSFKAWLQPYRVDTRTGRGNDKRAVGALGLALHAVLLLWLLGAAAPTLAAPTLPLYAAIGSYSLAGYGEWRQEADDAPITPGQLAQLGAEQFKPIQTDSLNIGLLNGKAAWIRVRLRNPHSNLQNWRLTLDEGRLGRLDAWLLGSEDKPQLLGHTGPAQPAANLASTLELTLPPRQERVLVLRLSGWQPLAPTLRLRTPATSMTQAESDGVWLGLAFGALLMVLMQNLLLFATQHQRGYLWLAAFAAVFALNRAVPPGLLAWRFPTLDGGVLLELSRGLGSVILLTFTSQFFEAPRQHPQMQRLLYLCVGLTLLGSLRVLWQPFACVLCEGLVNLVNGIVLWACLRSGERDGAVRLFLLGWVLHLLATALVTTQAFGWLPDIPAPPFLPLYAGIIAVSLFSTASIARRPTAICAPAATLAECSLQVAEQARAAALAKWQQGVDAIHRADPEDQALLTRKLNDGPLKQLIIANLRLHWQRFERKHREDQTGTAKHARELLLNASRESHFLLNAWSPQSLHLQGLAIALADLARQMNRVSHIHFRYLGKPHLLPDNPALRDLLFRAACELSLNVVRHSRAAIAEIHLSTDAETLELMVWNDGTPPILPVTEGFGLANLREDLRPFGGELRLEYAHPGFRASLHLPLALMV